MVEAQTALYDITTAPAPQRVVQSRIDELIERKAEEKVNVMLYAKLRKLAEGEK